LSHASVDFGDASTPEPRALVEAKRLRVSAGSDDTNPTDTPVTQLAQRSRDQRRCDPSTARALRNRNGEDLG
jgi:hypothetical protein